MPIDSVKVFSKALARGRVLEFLSQIEPCLVEMEACAGAHHWGREISALGHDVRLIAPQYVILCMRRHMIIGKQIVKTLRLSMAETNPATWRR